MRDRHLDRYVDVVRRARQLWSSSRQLYADAMLDLDWDNLRVAHAWAIDTADLEAADEIVATAGPHAWCRVRHEHGVWARRNLTLDTVDRRAHPNTYGWAGYWAFVSHDHDRVFGLARKGIDAAPAPDHPDTAWCWSVLVNADLASGKAQQAQEDAMNAQAAAAENREPFVRWWVLAAAVDVAFETDLAAVTGWMDQLVSLTGLIDAPSLRARNELYKGRQRMWVDDPPDGKGALACYRKGLELARNAGDIQNANLNLVGIVYATTELQLPEARQACSEAITCLYDARQWSALWLALSAIASWWKALGNLEEMAVICGHVKVHQPPWIDLKGSIRDHPALSHEARLRELMAEGGAMDRDHLVSFVLDRLANGADTYNDRRFSTGRWPMGAAPQHGHARF